MYIWVAVDVDQQLKGLRDQVVRITEAIHSDNSALTLPFHISLRISFQTEDSLCEEVVNRISDYFLTLSAFQVDIEKTRTYVFVFHGTDNYAP